MHSIKQIGLLQPIVVRRTPAGQDAEFEIVAGERRWRACVDAGLPAVPVIVRETSDDALLQESLLENLHRANLNPLEEGAAYSQLLHDFDCTQEVLAQRLGRSRSQVANSIRLLRLPTAVQRRVAAGVLSAGHARALLGLSDADQMERLATRIVAEGLSVRDVEEAVALTSRDNRPTQRTRSKRRLPVEYQAVADRLSERFETRVTVAAGAKRGRIVIDFSDTDDLARIVEALEGRLLKGPTHRRTHDLSGAALAVTATRALETISVAGTGRLPSPLTSTMPDVDSDTKRAALLVGLATIALGFLGGLRVRPGPAASGPPARACPGMTGR